MREKSILIQNLNIRTDWMFECPVLLFFFWFLLIGDTPFDQGWTLPMKQFEEREKR